MSVFALRREEDLAMKGKHSRYAGMTSGLGMVALLLGFSLLLIPYKSGMAADDRSSARELVDNATATFSDFINDPNYTWIRKNMDHAKGVLIFPQVLKGSYIIGGPGARGVLMIKGPKKGDWSDPAFYTIGSKTLESQIGGEGAEVVMVVMTRKAVEALLSSSFELGTDASVAIGPLAMEAGVDAVSPDVTADFVSFARSQGHPENLNLEGAVVQVNGSLNVTYYGENVKPRDIIAAMNNVADELRESLKCEC